MFNITNDTEEICGSYFELISGITNIILLVLTISSEILGKSNCEVNSLVDLPNHLHRQLSKKKTEKNFSLNNI